LGELDVEEVVVVVVSNSALFKTDSKTGVGISELSTTSTPAAWPSSVAMGTATAAKGKEERLLPSFASAFSSSTEDFC